MPESPISDEMLAGYEKDGYTVARGLLDAADLERWTERLADIVDGRVEPSEGMLVMKDVMVVKGHVQPNSKLEAIAKIQDYERDPVLDTYTTHPSVLDCVERFVGRDVMTIHTMLINKPPNVDGRHPLHQDLLYFPFRPADKIVASWTALQPVTREMGCLVVVPGSHRGGLLQHENPDWEHLNAGYFGARNVDDELEKRVHLEMDPGDTAFFHPMLLHGSGRNRTQGFRRAISAHYSSVDVRWEWSQQQFFGRNYRVVRGARSGQFWDGERMEESTINPLDYVSLGNKSDSGD
ncbi:MAG: phytanoyl-CoA dioxygenase family protein [Myxococcales bacterium]|nr:phytanoyl-CoA dioxygenase family protein [Myxococcales bacterium]